MPSSTSSSYLHLCQLFLQHQDQIVPSKVLLHIIICKIPCQAGHRDHINNSISSSFQHQPGPVSLTSHLFLLFAKDCSLSPQSYPVVAVFDLFYFLFLTGRDWENKSVPELELPWCEQTSPGCGEKGNNNTISKLIKPGEKWTWTLLARLGSDEIIPRYSN